MFAWLTEPGIFYGQVKLYASTASCAYLHNCTRTRKSGQII